MAVPYLWPYSKKGLTPIQANWHAWFSRGHKWRKGGGKGLTLPLLSLLDSEKEADGSCDLNKEERKRRRAKTAFLSPKKKNEA
jgi:hypothetical protein